ncbi:MAG: endonuclease III [Candidatus Sericytochromatia bacterium]
MKKSELKEIFKVLKEEVKQWKQPVVGAAYRDPFKILIATILSLRTKDSVTEDASDRLFSLAETPEKMITLEPEIIEKAIYPVGFYKRKAINILEICKLLLDKYDGKVPDDLDELLKIKGVGRKTANLTITLGYNKLGICVDIHVHRITNRWGYVKTNVPDETEMELRKILPEEYWLEINDLLVCYGQNLCKPISPFCSKCKINDYCKKVGVDKYR